MGLKWRIAEAFVVYESPFCPNRCGAPTLFASPLSGRMDALRLERYGGEKHSWRFFKSGSWHFDEVAYLVKSVCINKKEVSFGHEQPAFNDVLKLGVASPCILRELRRFTYLAESICNESAYWN